MSVHDTCCHLLRLCEQNISKNMYFLYCVYFDNIKVLIKILRRLAEKWSHWIRRRSLES